jgi:hypothetical protein
MDGIRPSGQMPATGFGAFRCGCVVPVVPREVEVGEMVDGIAPMVLGLSEERPETVFSDLQNGDVEPVLGRRVGGRGALQVGEAGADSVRREVLDASVVLVTAGTFADPGELEFAEGP